MVVSVFSDKKSMVRAGSLEPQEGSDTISECIASGRKELFEVSRPRLPYFTQGGLYPLNGLIRRFVAYGRYYLFA